jgi:ligand-binding SRPBCC domain-containing protein
MPTFDYTFTVRAPLPDVAAFHHNTQALKLPTPPLVFVKLHKVEPLGEGSVSEFSMWFGPFAVHWVAVHSNVDPLHGFTDTQVEGPLKRWVHTHHFTAEGESLTRIHEHIECEHRSGARGLLTRLLFSPLALRGLFTYRKLITRLSLVPASKGATQ